MSSTAVISQPSDTGNEPLMLHQELNRPPFVIADEAAVGAASGCSKVR